MEFCAEGTLESLVAGSGNGLPEPSVRKYTRQLLTAVASLHFHGIVHRDIKSNYLDKVIFDEVIFDSDFLYHFYNPISSFFLS